MEITIRDEGMVLGIGDMPNRKRKALYRMHGCRIDPIAYFMTDEDAAWMERFLGYICERANQGKRVGDRLDCTPDLTKCPRCGGPADNGHDRELPPNVYACSKCTDEISEGAELLKS